MVGFGNVAVQGHLPAWERDKHFDIVAVCDPDDARMRVAAELLPQARRYASADELLQNERLDFVDVATPPATHTPLVLDAVARQLNVLCEKPLALRSDDTNRMRAAASASRVVVFTAHNWKSAPIIRTAKRLLRRGEIGAVRKVEITTDRTAPPGGEGDAAWRLDPAAAGGGILVDHGWHAFYLGLHFIDAEPTAVSARTERRRFVESGVEDTAACSVELGAATLDIQLTWAADARRNRIVVEGVNGSVDIDDRRLVVRAGERPPQETAFAQPLSAGSYHPDWFAGMLDEFREELNEPAVRGSNFREAERCCRLLELAYASAAADGARLPFRTAVAPATSPGG
jgi:predicted dehydrogenase